MMTEVERQALRDAQPSWKRGRVVAKDVQGEVARQIGQVRIQGDGVTGGGMDWTIRKPKVRDNG